MTWRLRPRNSSTHTSHRLTCHARLTRPSASWRTPRLPMKVPRSGVAMISPNGVTRFCLGIGSPPSPADVKHPVAATLELIGDDGGFGPPAPLCQVGADRPDVRRRFPVQSQQGEKADFPRHPQQLLHGCPVELEI